MKPFRFRLETVLSLRARQLDMAQSDRALAQAEVTRLERALEVLAHKISLLKAGRGGIATAWLAQQAGRRTEWYEQRRQGLTDDLSRARQLLLEKERRVLLARRELRKFELLKERRRLEWRARELGAEQKELDEVGSRLRRRAQIAADGGKPIPVPAPAAL